jgi:hypothetical protein
VAGGASEGRKGGGGGGEVERIEWGGCSSTDKWNKERVGGRRREEMRCTLAYDCARPKLLWLNL